MSTPKITPAVPEPSHLRTCALKDPRHRQALRTLQRIVCTSRGPHGRLKTLHNDVGGHVTLTSSCARLWSNMSVENPVLKLMRSCVQGHVESYSDGGLFAAGLALTLILNGLDLDMHAHLVSDCFEFFLKEALSCMQDDLFSCRAVIDSCNLDDLNTVIRSVLSSKPGCDFWPNEMDHIVSLILTGYLRTSTSSDSQDLMQYVTIEGPPISDSFLNNGILFQTPSIPTYRNKPLEVAGKDGRIMVAVFNVSMAGDTSEQVDADYTVASSDDLDEVVMAKMLQCATSLVELGVGLVLCQRVIHPAVKKYLKQHNVLVLDRLGINCIYAVRNLTGARMLGSFTVRTVSAEDLGVLDSVDHVVIQKKSYVHLQKAESSVCTLVLHGRSEEALAELKHTCLTARHVLHMAMRESVCLSGGGCWQTCLALLLYGKMQQNSSVWSEELGCTKHQLQSACHAFCSSLSYCTSKDSAYDHMTDSSNHHHWQVFHSNAACDRPNTCACGAIKRTSGMKHEYITEALSTSCCFEPPPWTTSSPCKSVCEKQKPQLLDSYSASLNAMKIGVATAVMILGICNVIENAS